MVSKLAENDEVIFVTATFLDMFGFKVNIFFSFKFKILTLLNHSDL